MRTQHLNPRIYLLFILALSLLLIGGCTSTPPADDQPEAENGGETVQEDTEEPAEEVVEEPAEDPAEAHAPEPAAPEANLTDDCVEDYAEGIDYFPEKVSFEYAQSVVVEYFDNYKVVEILTPWPGAGQTFSYVLVQCGTPAPEGVVGTVIEVPVSTVIPISTTLLPSLDTLGLVDQIVAVDNFAYPNTQSIRDRIEAGELVEIGEGSAVNVETVLDLDPSLIITTGSGIPDYDAHPVLIEAGLPVVILSEWIELVPLGRAEWIKYVGLFYNREADTAAAFDDMVTQYNEVADLASAVEEKPTVLPATPWQGTWYMPGGASYVAQLFEDAGAEFLWADNPDTGTLYLDFETVYEVAQGADLWVNVTFFDLETMLAEDERYSDFAAYQNGEVYAYNKRTNEFFGNDFWENGAAHPEWVLMDLVKIFHPELLPDHELYFYQKIQ